MMKHKCKLSTLIFVVAMLWQIHHANGQIGITRVWTDAHGRKLEAKWLSMEAEAVLVQVEYQAIFLDIEKLSASDRAYVEGHRKWVTVGEAGALRLWTDLRGRQVHARLLRVLDADSVLVRVGEKPYKMMLNQLSLADRQYVEKLRPPPPPGQVLDFPVQPNPSLKAWLDENHMRSLQWKGVPCPTADEFALPFQLHVPSVADNGRPQKLPLLVHLHGTGGIGKDNMKQLSDGKGVAKFYMDKSFQEDQACYVMLPQTDIISGWTTLSLRGPSYAMRAIVHAIRILIATPGYHIDPMKVYIIGLSMGGTGACQGLAKFPGFFAGAVSISSVSSSKLFHPGNVGPLWIVVNRQDQNMEDRLNQFRPGFEAVGGTLYATVNARNGHDAWTDLLRDRKFRDWLFRRDTKVFGE